SVRAACGDQRPPIRHGCIETHHLFARRKRARETPEAAREASASRTRLAGHSVSARIRVGLFVTCLVDLVRPQVGFAAVKLLEQAGCDVEIPRTQTCCGQPAWNAGADKDASDIARDVIAAFVGFDYVVAPSGSCAGMI